MHYSPAPMHIPDGFLSIYVAIIFWIVTLLLVVYALKRVNQDLGEKQVPLMGVLAAAIFAGQMLNFAVAGGTSGHMLGATLATILLGPWAAILVMTCVVGVQALIFQDGGLLALGANIFNMAIIGVSVSYFAYRTVQKLAGGKPWGLYVGGFAAAWLAVFVASLATALELAISGTSPANIALPTMGAVHALIGIGEGLITVGALGLPGGGAARSGEAQQGRGASRPRRMAGGPGDRVGPGGALSAGVVAPGWTRVGGGAARIHRPDAKPSL